MNSSGLDLSDSRWSRLVGGYRIPYDPRQALRSLELGEDVDAAWQELIGELYHQGDVGDASYAAVPHLVRIHELRGVPDWNTYALVAMIEEGRRAPQNPTLPDDLREAYDIAWRRLILVGLREIETAEDPYLIRCIIAVLAMGKGQFQLGRFAILFNEDERKALLDRAGWP